jgi:eukaryotic-like serine/threonine-protein kinase
MTPIEQQTMLENLVDEFTAKMRAGSNPSIQNYLQRFPQLKNELEDLLGSVAMIEDLKRQSESPGNSLSQTFAEISRLERLGDYEIVREIGRGGMGIVFEAIHSSLGRRVAIKVLPIRSSTSQKYIERFRREAQAAASLHHTNIVSVFGVGHSEGHHYYVMEFVDGVGLDSVIRELRHQTNARLSGTSSPTHVDQSHSTRLLSDPPENDLEPDQHALTISDSKSLVSQSLIQNLASSADRYRWAAKLVAQVADAMHYAHQQKILHRDFKPGNLILDRNNKIWITDFGLARIENEPSVTQTTDIIGTPQYMAPESFEGTYDRHSEIYCLGITLYELLALKPAYPQKSTQEIIRAITTSGPKHISKLAQTIPRDLQTIVHKAIARNPQDRYADAAAFRDDLMAFFETRPINARKMSLLDQSSKWARRNPLSAGLLATTCVLLVLIAIISTVAYAWQTHAIGELAKKHEQLLQQQQETEIARKLAVENQNKIAIQFERAESNVAFTLTALDEIFKQFLLRNNAGENDLDIDGYNELSGIEFALTKEDAQYLESFVSFYEEFAEQNADSQRLYEETARVYRRVANIHHMIGNFEKAMPAYREAIKRYSVIAEKEPTTSNRLHLIITRNELAKTHRMQGRWNATRRELTSTVAMIQQWESDSTEIQLELAKTYLLMGTATWRDEAQMIRMVADDSNDERNRRNRGMRNRFRQVRGEAEDEQFVNKAIEIAQSQLKIEPTNPATRYLLAQGYRCLAIYMFSRGEVDAGKTTIQMSVAQLESLVNDFNEVDHYRYALALTNIGRSSYMDDPQQSLELAANTANALLAKQPGNLEYQQLDANANLFLAEHYLELKRFDDAIPLAESALAQFESLCQKFPRVATYIFNAAEARFIVVFALMSDKRYVKAESLLEKAIVELENDKQNPRFTQQLLVRHYQIQARLLSQRGKLAESRAASQKARQITNNLKPNENPPPRRR